MRNPKRTDQLEKKYRQKLFKQIGDYLAEKRQSTGLTQSDIARISGYSSQFISNIECGTAFPPAGLMTSMIDAYRLSEKDFLDTLMRFQSQYYKEVYFESSAKAPAAKKSSKR